MDPNLIRHITHRLSFRLLKFSVGQNFPPVKIVRPLNFRDFAKMSPLLTDEILTDNIYYIPYVSSLLSNENFVRIYFVHLKMLYLLLQFVFYTISLPP